MVLVLAGLLMAIGGAVWLMTRPQGVLPVPIRIVPPRRR